MAEHPQIVTSKLHSLLSKTGTDATVKWYAEKCGLPFDEAAQAVAFRLFKSYDEQNDALFDLFLCKSLWNKYKLTDEDIEELACKGLSIERDERSSELEAKLYKWHIQYPHYSYIVNSLYFLFPELRQRTVLSKQRAETLCRERLGLPENKRVPAPETEHSVFAEETAIRPSIATPVINSPRKSKLSYRVVGGTMAICYLAMAFPSIIDPLGDPSLFYLSFQVVFHLLVGLGCYLMYADWYYTDGDRSCWSDWLDAVIYGVWMGLSISFLFGLFGVLE